MGESRTDMIPCEEGTFFVAVNVKTRLPEVRGWYLTCTNAKPHACGKLWFDGTKFEISDKVYHYSSLLSNGYDLFWLEIREEAVV